jgi:hypothetical protein
MIGSIYTSSNDDGNQELSGLQMTFVQPATCREQCPMSKHLPGKAMVLPTITKCRIRANFQSFRNLLFAHIKK